jgi:hypothetical protein
LPQIILKTQSGKRGQTTFFRSLLKRGLSPFSLSISAIAARLADDVEGSNRSVALAVSRIADGAQLMVERALDHLEELMAARKEAKT